MVIQDVPVGCLKAPHLYLVKEFVVFVSCTSHGFSSDV